MAFPITVQLGYGQEKEESSSQKLKLGTRGETPDGRVLFAIPWYDRAIVGTTDVPRDQIETEPRPLDEEVNFILSLSQEYLDPPPKESDILSIFAGLRPLVSPPSRGDVSSAQISREHTVLMLSLIHI